MGNQENENKMEVRSMKHLGTIVGAAIAGMFVMSVWGELAGAYGLVGGWFAAFIIIGVMWFMNHFVGLINNDGAWGRHGCRNWCCWYGKGWI